MTRTMRAEDKGQEAPHQGDSSRMRAASLRLTGAAVVGLLIVVGFGLLQGVRAARAAAHGRAALLRAEDHLSAQRVGDARRELVTATKAFQGVGHELDRLGPLATVARITPLVRSHVRAVEAMADAGVLLATAGLRLADAAGEVVEPADRHVPVAGALDSLRKVHESLGAGREAAEAARGRVASIGGGWLIGPVGKARGDLAERLPRLAERAARAERGVGAMIAFAGGSGPRRYLLLSQNPDEVRPTGGFIGTYGVLAASGGDLAVERYDSIESWRSPPVSRAELASSFRLDPRTAQTLANVNTVPDWPQVARHAVELWQQAGEQPVDGVVSYTPAFLARLLSVLGPITIPAYGETVTAANLVERLDYHTHVATSDAPGDRKEFIAVLAHAVIQRLLDAPASRWEPVARVVGQGLDAREAMAWSLDADVAGVLAARGWDGALPASPGDFLYPAEFSYAAKNGRGIRRTYEHRVALRADGSGLVSTTITIANTEAPDRLNAGYLAYVTLYGPQGAVLHTSSDGLAIPEKPLAGHPAAGWFRGAEPLGQTTLTVAWDSPQLLQRRDDGAWEYRLTWMRMPDHEGDVLHLKVELPTGWHWQGGPPPSTFELKDDVEGRWRLQPPSSNR